MIANATVHDILGYAPVYAIPAFSLVSDWELGLYLLLASAPGAWHRCPCACWSERISCFVGCR